MLYTTILQSNLDARELRSLAEELRRGRLSDELAFMLDQAVEHFQVSDLNDEENIFIDEVEQLIKERRISKESLFNIITSIDVTILPKNFSKMTVKQMISAFFDNANKSQVKKLIDVLSSSSAPDPYLKGISEKRK
jgi:hypothetical protein